TTTSMLYPQRWCAEAHPTKRMSAIYGGHPGNSRWSGRSDLIGNHVGSSVVALDEFVGFFGERAGEAFGLGIEGEPGAEGRWGCAQIDAVGGQVRIDALEGIDGELVALDLLFEL